MPTIYISSTYEDLKDYRQIVFETLRKSGYEVKAMEEYVASDRRPLDQCLRDVEEADLYVGLFAFRYGYVPPEGHGNANNLSITELELRRAEDLNKPCLTFVMDNTTPWARTFDDAHTAEDKGERIQALRQNLLREKLCSTFSSPNQLATLVLTAVTNHFKDREKTDRPIAPSISKSKGSELEDKPVAPIIINTFPNEVPIKFYGRTKEMDVLQRHLADNVSCLLTVYGRKGCGKTTTVCKVLQTMIEDSQSHSSKERTSIDGIVFVKNRESQPVSWLTIFSEIQNLLPDQEKSQWETLFQIQEIPLQKKIEQLLKIISQKRIVVFIDPFGPMVDQVNGSIRDPDLSEALQTLLETHGHRIKIILTLESPLTKLSMVKPSRQAFINLKDGLGEIESETMLRDSDHDGSIGLQKADPQVIGEICTRLRGNPRALIKLTTLLRVNQSMRLSDVSNHTKDLLPQEILDDLVGQVFRSLDTHSRMVLQSIAIFGQPIPREAVEWVLRSHISQDVLPDLLNSLVNRRLVKMTTKCFSLDYDDRQYVLSTIPNVFGQTSKNQSSQDFTREGLGRLARKYYRSNRVPPEQWKFFSDLDCYLAEFELLIESRIFEDAVQILFEIENWLLKNGRDDTVAKLYSQINEECLESESKLRYANKLGNIYHRLGKLEKAIAYYQKGLNYTQHLKERERKRNAEFRYLSNLGICHKESGDLDLAIAYCRQSLHLAQELKDTSKQAHVLNTLSDCRGNIGEISQAIEACEKTLSLAQSCGSEWQAALALTNLGLYHGELCAFEKAVGYSQEALSLSHLIEYRLGEGAALINLGEMNLVQKKFSEAMTYFNKATQLSDTIKRAELQQKSRVGLALTHLYNGTIKIASDYLREACVYEIRGFDFYALSIQGIVAFVHGENDLAKDSFHKAITCGEQMLRREPRFYLAWLGKGIAHSGLSIIERDESHADFAKKAFQKGKYINPNIGIMKKTQMVLGKLEEATPIQFRHDIQEITGMAS